MATERLSSQEHNAIFPTAGFGSPAPTWIKADLLKTETMRSAVQPTKAKVVLDPYHWLRKQFGLT